MILDVSGNPVETQLQKGDLIIFNPDRKTISFRRGNYYFVLPSGGNYEMPFSGGEDGFAKLIILLSYTHNFEHSPTRMNEINFSQLMIKGAKCICYYF